MKCPYFSGKRLAEEGQGLIEYALILVLVAVVVIAILLILGPTVGSVFSNIVSNLERTGIIDGGGSSDVVVITKAHYKADKKLHLDATSDGGYNPSVSLTASPGSVMEARPGGPNPHYHLDYALSGCPCTVTVTSSKGGSASVTVGP